MSHSFASPSEVIEQQRRDGARSTEQHLEMLIENFVLAARHIDPSIQNVWVGRDGENFDRPFFISLERQDSMFRRKV